MWTIVFSMTVNDNGRLYSQINIVPEDRRHEVPGALLGWARLFETETDALAEAGSFDWDNIIIWRQK